MIIVSVWGWPRSTVYWGGTRPGRLLKGDNVLLLTFLFIL